MFAPNRIYPRSPQCLIVVFDLRVPEAAAVLNRQRAAWQGYASVKILDGELHALVIRPGGARRLLRGHCEGEND